MKTALQKSPIPQTHAFVAKNLKQPIFDPNWHFHREYQIFMVLKGRGTRFIGDTIQPYKEGDITFTGPNLPHLWRSDPESPFSEGIVVYFNEDVLGETLLAKEEGIKLRQVLRKSMRGVSVHGHTADWVGERLRNLIRSQGFLGVLELLGILHLLSLSGEIELLASPGYTNSLKEGDTQRMNLVYAHVMKHYKRKITVREMAALTNMAPTSFSRYFSTHANKTFSGFISEIRIGQACKLLIEQKMNASQTCYESGFQTMSNFNKQFKALTGRTPMAYKRAFGGNA